jgi:histidinol-phosphate aminotransferase
MNSRDGVSAESTAVVRDEIRTLSAYHVADSAGLIKLDAMENPYGLPRELKSRLASIVAEAAINRYPDAQGHELKAALREALAIPANREILLGNGSDEIIQMLALAVARPGAVLLAPEPSFVMYKIIAQLTGMQYVGVPLGADFSLDRVAMLSAIERYTPALVFLASPNNPTGNLFDAAVIEEILGAAGRNEKPGLVVVDEAYHAFARASFMGRLEHHANLLVMRTLSKLGLAGLRMGLLAGGPRIIGEIDKVRLPYNVGVLTQLVAIEVLKHGDVLAAQAAAIVRERGHLTKALKEMAGLTVYDSAANFILFKVREAARVYAGIRDRGVLVKNLSGGHPALADCLRVSVGTPPQNDMFLAALRESI